MDSGPQARASKGAAAQTQMARLMVMARDRTGAAVAQLVERVLGKDEVMGPSPISSFVYK